MSSATTYSQQFTALDQSQADRSGLATYWSFVICLLVVSLPVKNLAYLAPLVYLALQLWAGNSRLLARTAMLVSIVAMVSITSVVLDSLRMREVNLPGVFLGVLTHLPLFIILCESFDRTMQESTYRRIVDVCCWFVIIQSTIGLMQYAAFGNPDTVSGTFGLFDGLRSQITIAQVHFTFTIFGMLLFLLPEYRRRLVAFAFVIGLVACVAAQSGHQTIFLAVALGFCVFAGAARLRLIVISAVMIAVTTACVVFFYPETYHLSKAWYQKVVDPSSPKRIVTEGGVDVQTDLKNSLLGAGLGQYSSRAALITSNDYLSVDLPQFLSGSSGYYNDYVMEGQAIFEESGEGSAISKPYFSLLSLWVELGCIGFCLLMMVFGYAFFWNLGLMRKRVPTLSLIGLGGSVGIALLLLCCLVENYFEFPQAIFIPFLLYVIAMTRAKQQLNGPDTSLEQSRSQPTS